MARSPRVVVQIDQQQFNQFMNNFNNLSSMMTNMQGQWNILSQNIAQATQRAANLNSMMQNLNVLTGNMARTIPNITSHLYKWVGLVGSVGAVLTGASLFGFERYFTKIMQQRREL